MGMQTYLIPSGWPKFSLLRDRIFTLGFDYLASLAARPQLTHLPPPFSIKSVISIMSFIPLTKIKTLEPGEPAPSKMKR